MSNLRVIHSCDHYDCARVPTAVYSGFAVEEGAKLYCYHPAYCDEHAAQLGEPDPQKVHVTDINADTQ